MPGPFETDFGTWTRSAVPASYPTTTAPDPAVPRGPGDDLYGYAAVYELDGRFLAIGPSENEARYDDDVFLVAYRRTEAGGWERSDTSPPMPAYRMRHAAQLSVAPVVRGSELLVFDASGTLLSIDADGRIAAAGPPPLEPARDASPTTGFPPLAATADTYVALVKDGLAMWKVGWPEWRRFTLPHGAGLPMPYVAQPGVTDGRFHVDVYGPSSQVRWELAEPA